MRTSPRRSFWLSVLALLVALGSAAFTEMQWYEAHEQGLASTTPHVDFEVDTDPDEFPLGLAVRNAGPGQAIIKSVTFYVDRKSVKGADEAGRDYAKLTDKELGYQELEPGDTLSVGEQVWLINYRKLRGTKAIQKNVERFADFLDQNLAIEITYCSAFREDRCWSKCSTKDRCK